MRELRSCRVGDLCRMQSSRSDVASQRKRYSESHCDDDLAATVSSSDLGDRASSSPSGYLDPITGLILSASMSSLSVVRSAAFGRARRFVVFCPTTSEVAFAHGATHPEPPYRPISLTNPRTLSPIPQH
jgi:hypothetical protein